MPQLYIRFLWISTILSLHPFALASQPHPEAGSLTYTDYTADEHGGGSISTGIGEDRHGNLYIANEAGLLKFDGVNWNLMPATGHTDYVSSVAIDQQDRIWVSGLKSIGYYSTDQQGRNHYHDMTSSIEHLPERAKIGTFWKLYAYDSHIYLIASQHVLRWDGSEWKAWSFQDQRRILPSWVDGHLYIHSRGTGLFRLKNDSFELIAKEVTHISSGIISIMQMPDGALLCATHTNGLFYLQGDSFRRFSTNVDANIMDARFSRNKRIVLSTAEQGILIISQTGSLITQIPTPKTQVYSTYEDLTGSTWAATTGSILEIPDLGFTSFSETAHDIARHQGKIYYTNKHELRVLDSDTGKTPSLPTTIRSATAIWDLYSTDTGLIYGSATAFNIYNGSPPQESISSPRHIVYLYPSWLNRKIIYSNDPPTISRWTHSVSGWRHLDSLQNFNSRALSVTELPNSKLLISNENSPMQWATWPLPDSGTQQEPTITTLGRSQGLPEKFIWAHCLRIHDWVIVISDRGLYRYDSTTETFHYNPVLGNNLGTDAYGLESCPAADNDGWILRLPSGGQHQNVVGHLSTSDGKQFEWTAWQLPSLHLTGKVEALLHEKIDGLEVLWVGGSKELLRYDLTNMPAHPAPRTRLTAIREQDSHQTYFGGAGAAPTFFEWEYPQKTLHISYAAVPSPIQVASYQTRLTGFDQEWSEPTDITFRDFTNLSPGSYAFEVRTIDEFGRFGAHANLSFTILPPWYQTVYAYLGYTCVLIASLVLVGRWRNRTLRIQNQRLEDMIHERTVELQEQQLQLIKANKAKQDFLASMSHEIRNPLNGILGIVNLMYDQEQQTGITTPQTTHLFTSANHLHQLLGQTLDYSSLEAGKLRARIEPFEACKLIDQVIDMHLSMAKQKGLNLKSRKPDSPCHWKGDPVLLRQVLINLVSNAIKYTPQGSVTLALSFETGEDSVNAHFEVSDTGPGIPKDQKTYIFEEFTRLSKPGEAEIPGTGLGLAIAARVSALMGGTLRLDSSYTRGARFTLDIELEQDLHSQVSNQEPQSSSQLLSGRRVLIADDIDFNRYIAVELLKTMGATVDSVSNGEEALKQLRSDNYDIVILDINMPMLSGLEVVEQFSETGTGKTPEFIALSAYNTREMEIRSLNAGFDYFMEKPLDPAKLISLFGNRDKTTSNAQGILDYIAGDDSQTQEELEGSFRASFNAELQSLKDILATDNQRLLGETVHKLIGMASIRTDNTLTALLQELAKQLKDSPTESTLQELLSQIQEVIDNQK